MYRRFSRKTRRLLYIACVFVLFVTVWLHKSTFNEDFAAQEASNAFQKSFLGRTTTSSNAAQIYDHEVASRETMSHKSVVLGERTQQKVSIDSEITTKPLITNAEPSNSQMAGKIVAGRRRKKKAFLVIGIPSAYRPYTQYLGDTVKQLVNGLSEEEKNEVLIIVFTTDFEKEHREVVVINVVKNFRDELESGLINVIEFPASVYPSLKNLPPLWNDKPDRILWRSKQCLDYALLFQYCCSLGNFYLQLEDDISVDVGYLKVMKAFMQSNKNTKWSVLEFGARGFIGILYRASDLKRLSMFVKMYYWIWPVDILFRHFNDFNLYGNPKFARLKKPLFRHVGSYSSLKGQVRKLEDLTTASRLHKDAHNPKASVFTSIAQYGKVNIMETYAKDGKAEFWGNNVQVNDNVTIAFVKPESISQLIIETGGPAAPDDFIGGATLYVSFARQEQECRTFMKWKTFTNVASLTARFALGKLIKCIQLTITKLRFNANGNARWLRIREIAVWVKK